MSITVPPAGCNDGHLPLPANATRPTPVSGMSLSSTWTPNSVPCCTRPQWPTDGGTSTRHCPTTRKPITFLGKGFRQRCPVDVVVDQHARHALQRTRQRRGTPERATRRAANARPRSGGNDATDLGCRRPAPCPGGRQREAPPPVRSEGGRSCLLLERASHDDQVLIAETLINVMLPFVSQASEGRRTGRRRPLGGRGARP